MPIPPIPQLLSDKRILPRSFYRRPVTTVARACLGQILVHATHRGWVAGIIVETEAYAGPRDRAAHSYGGRRTARNEAMFGPAGHAYVFFLYGMHYLFNLVTGAVGQPQAVLVRALEPCCGEALMHERRGHPRRRVELTSGPGKLCQALGIGPAEYGLDLCKPPLFLVEGCSARTVACSPRIGVGYAGEWASKSWRFFDPNSPFVSGAGRAHG